MASHVALEEAGAEYKPCAINIFKGEHMTPEYRAINPRSKVPALQFQDGSTLVESPAILSWIARAYPDHNLMGRNELEEARCISICSWLASTVHPAFGRWVRPERFAGDDASQAAVKLSAKQTYWESLQEIDRILTGRPWLTGSNFTLCDPYALVFYAWGPELALPVSDLKNFTAMKNRVLERPAARRALEREESQLLTMQ